MSRTKLISVRVDEEDLKKIDDYASKFSWRKRSDVINTAVTIIAEAIDRGLIEEMIRYYPRYWDIKEFSFKCERKQPR